MGLLALNWKIRPRDEGSPIYYLMACMFARSPVAMAVALLLLGGGRIHALAAVDSASGAAPTGTCPPTITQSGSQVIAAGNSVSCNSGPPGLLHFDTSYWRAFDMA